MSRVIDKYPLSPAHLFFLPTNHRVIHFGIIHRAIDRDVQQGTIHLWAEVDPDSPKRPFAAVVVPTGEEPPENAKHAWTWFDGPYVWHLYVDAALQLRGES